MEKIEKQERAEMGVRRAGMGVRVFTIDEWEMVYKRDDVIMEAVNLSIRLKDVAKIMAYAQTHGMSTTETFDKFLETGNGVCCETGYIQR